jgi:hypothetical protein
VETYFTPVEREEPVPAVENTGFIALSIRLNYDPVEEWVQLFNQATGWTTAFDPPQVHYGQISARCRDTTLIEQVMDNIDKRIAKANADYESSVVPRLKAAHDRRAREDEEQEQKLSAAREALKDYKERHGQPPED